MRVPRLSSERSSVEQAETMATDLKMGDLNQQSSNNPDRKSVSEGNIANVAVPQLPPLLRNLSPEELDECEKRLRRKIDMRLLPALILIYIMNYLDRQVYPESFSCGGLIG